jgi:hypothetical protein
MLQPANEREGREGGHIDYEIISASLSHLKVAH